MFVQTYDNKAWLILCMCLIPYHFYKLHRSILHVQVLYIRVHTDVTKVPPPHPTYSIFTEKKERKEIEPSLSVFPFKRHMNIQNLEGF